MGRTIKISELKKFDVFLFEGERFVATNYDADEGWGNAYVSLDSNNWILDDSFWEDKITEVELLGRMEFKSELNEVEKDLVGGLGDFADFLKSRP